MVCGEVVALVPGELGWQECDRGGECPLCRAPLCSRGCLIWHGPTCPMGHEDQATGINAPGYAPGDERRRYIQVVPETNEAGIPNMPVCELCH